MKRNRIFLSLGLVLLVSVFILFTNIGKNRAVSYAGETLEFLKEKCRGFDALMGSIEGAQPKTLLSLHYYSSVYYGSLDHEGDYDLYVFYPSDAVFRLRSIALFYGVSLYAVFGLLFFWMRKKEEKEQLMREIACQDKMLASERVDMDRLSAGAVVLEQKAFDLKKLLEEVDQWAIPLAAERDILFHSEAPKVDHVKLYGSPVHLKKILTNIAGNAIKDNRGGDQVTFFCREIAEFILRKEGMQVIRAWNGKEALERFRASAVGEIPVILMDLVMPVMDGFEASRAIRALEREDAKDVVIIALTASNYEEDAKKCRLAGMNEHLPKPLDAGNLIQVIRKHIK